jgi:hypothetical protein
LRPRIIHVVQHVAAPAPPKHSMLDVDLAVRASPVPIPAVADAPDADDAVEYDSDDTIENVTMSPVPPSSPVPTPEPPASTFRAVVYEVPEASDDDDDADF